MVNKLGSSNKPTNWKVHINVLCDSGVSSVMRCLDPYDPLSKIVLFDPQGHAACDAYVRSPWSRPTKDSGAQGCEAWQPRNVKAHGTVLARHQQMKYRCFIFFAARFTWEMHGNTSKILITPNAPVAKNSIGRHRSLSTSCVPCSVIDNR